ncbi:MAG: hypothetical protein ABI806_15865 [Candidatus Solibacter sp.]
MKSREPKARDWTSRRHLIVCVGLCLVTLAAYSNSFGAGFVMDNRGLILQDTRVHAATAENLDLIVGHTYWWPYGESGLFRPLTTLSYLFNYALLGNGESPAGYHWLNLLLHVGNVLLVYALGLRLSEWRRAAAVAGLWAVHPLLTESITNIVGRADLLAGTAVLGGLLLYWKSTEAEGGRRWACLAALSAVTAGGAFSKESAVMLLPVVCLYEAVYWRERRGRGLVAGGLAILLPVQAMLYQRAAVLWSAGPTVFPFYDNPIVGAGWLTGRLTALNVMGKYVALLAWPWRLSSDYSWAQLPTGGGDWLAWIALAALVAAGVWLWRGEQVAWFVAGAALLVFLPTSNLLFAIGTIMAERFLYLPAIAFVAGVVAIVGRLEGRTATAALSVMGLLLAGRTWARNMDWQDDLALGRATVSASPGSFKAHKLLAFALHEGGKLDEAIAEAEKGLVPLKGLDDRRNNADSYMRTGGYYAERGYALHVKGDASMAGQFAYERALELLLKAKAIATTQTAGDGDPERFGPLLQQIAEVHRRLGNTGAALDAALEARRRDSVNPETHRQVARTLAGEGRMDEAAAALMEGVIMTADDVLRQELLGMYTGGLDRLGCATMEVQGHKALNPGCETVRRHLCAAAVGTMRLRVETGRQDLSDAMRQTALTDFHCKAEELK